MLLKLNFLGHTFSCSGWRSEIYKEWKCSKRPSVYVSNMVDSVSPRSNLERHLNQTRFVFSHHSLTKILGPPLVPIPPFYLRIGRIPRNGSLMWWPIWPLWPWHKQMMVCLVVVAREWPWNVVELPCIMALNGKGGGHLGLALAVYNE